MFDILEATESGTGRRIQIIVANVVLVEPIEDPLEDYGLHKVASYETAANYSSAWSMLHSGTRLASLITMYDGTNVRVLNDRDEVSESLGKVASIHMSEPLKLRFENKLELIRPTGIVPNVTVGYGTDKAHTMEKGLYTIARQVDDIIFSLLDNLLLDGSQQGGPKTINEILMTYRPPTKAADYDS